MKKVKLDSINIELTIDERITNDWRYMDYLTRSEDPELKAAERIRAINKSIELLLGMEQKDKALAAIAEANDGFVSYDSVFALLKEIGDALGKLKK